MGIADRDGYTIVKVNSADAAGYLEDQFQDHHFEASQQYNATQDALVEFGTVDSSGDRLLRLFIDVSDISCWDATTNSHWVGRRLARCGPRLGGR
jgi:hypothetical protein